MCVHINKCNFGHKWIGIYLVLITIGFQLIRHKIEVAKSRQPISDDMQWNVAIPAFQYLIKVINCNLQHFKAMTDNARSNYYLLQIGLQNYIRASGE